jgi:hypothetical protein
MSYFCRDCSYTGKAPAALGECPACGSRDFGRLRAAAQVEVRGGSSPAKLTLLAALWAWLIFEIYRKLGGA